MNISSNEKWICHACWHANHTTTMLPDEHQLLMGISYLVF